MWVSSCSQRSRVFTSVVDTVLIVVHGLLFLLSDKVIKGELHRRRMYEYRCDEQAEGSTRLAYTGLRGGLEHLKIETRLIDETRVVYYETIIRELHRRLTYECRCDERLKAKAEGSTCLEYTG